MRTILYIIQKEFIQIFRNKTMLPIIFILPLVQLLILVYAATLEMKHIDMYIVDEDMSTTSRKLVSKFECAPFYYVNDASFSIRQSEHKLYNDEVDVVLYIPNGFEKDLLTDKNADVQLIINAINGTAAGLINAYSGNVIKQFNQEIIIDWVNYSGIPDIKTIHLNYQHWYNPELNYKIYMLPGILVILVTIIGMFLSALNLVREKEIGTIEQINVTPIKKHHFLIGKLIPFWIIALFELSFGLLIGKIIFDIPILGSVGVLFLFAAVYLIVALGLGLFISTTANTQQQVLFVSFFFLIVFILMSGLFTPTDTMPAWAQKANIINPFYYFMRVIRMVLLKGSGIKDISNEFISMSIYAIGIMSLAIWRYRKRS